VIDRKVSVSTRSRHRGIDARDENHYTRGFAEHNFRTEASVGHTLGTTRVGRILPLYLCYAINLSAYRQCMLH